MAYRREPVNAPVVSGLPLRMFTRFVEGGVSGPFREKLLAEIGIDRLRAAVADAPVLSPRLPHPVPPDSVSEDPVGDSVMLERPEIDGFHFRSVADYQAAYSSGEKSPVDIARNALAASDESERGSRPMRIFIAQYRTDVMAQAEASAARWEAGEPLSPFDGVPVAVKDEVDQTPYPTTGGTKILGRVPAESDASTVARLRAAGAVLIGKTNMHEVGIGVTGINPHHGACRNPYDIGRVTGGSSSGPASAVAAGLGPVSLGADGGGSIRIPAGLCGLVGLKPTWGRVTEHGAVPLCWNVAHIGPIGANTRDVAAMYAVLAGRDDADENTWGQPVPHLNQLESGDLKGVRLGICRPWFEDAEPEIVNACQLLVDALVDAGAEVVQFEPPDIQLIRAAHVAVITSEMLAANRHHLKNHRGDFGLDTRVNFALASQLTNADYVHAMRYRHASTQEWLRLMSEIDAVVTPTTGRTASRIPEHALPDGESNLPVLDQIMRFAAVANLNGFPAIAIPAGYDAEGLPISCQFMGRPWEENLLLRIGHLCDGLIERRRPSRYWDLLA